MPASTSPQRITLTLTLLLASARLSAAEIDPGAATTAEAAREHAAELFEQGVRHFEARDYPRAARAFLDADATLPSARALANALSSAHRAGLPLLVVETARRARTRADLEPETARLFDAAMADAARHLAHVQLRCAPTPCRTTVDGAAATDDLYVEPGEHLAAAEGEGLRMEQRFTCREGELCPLALTLSPPAPGARAPAPAAARAPERADGPGARPLPPWVVVAGGTATIGLVAATIWSGLDALSARDRYPTDSPAYDPDDVRARALRTDVLLTSAVVVGGATAIAGLFFVDFGRTRASVGALPGGAIVSATGPL